jgi:predicted secreted protein
MTGQLRHYYEEDPDGQIHPPVSAVIAAAHLGAAVAAAEPTPPRYNTVTLQADAQREIQNDLLNATLFVEVNDATPGRRRQCRQQDGERRVARGEGLQGRAGPLGQQPDLPVYSKANQLQGWRGRGKSGWRAETSRRPPR